MTSSRRAFLDEHGYLVFLPIARSAFEAWQRAVAELEPGTHRSRFTADEIEKLRGDPHESHFEAGGILLMRPLLVHSSPPATHPGHRRVVHLEYCAAALPTALKLCEAFTSR